MRNIESIQSGGLLLCERYKLQPIDERNFELCELHTVPSNTITRKNGTAGTRRWRPCGRFYRHGTFSEAALFVADILLKERCANEALTIWQALQEYERIADGIARTLLEASRAVEEAPRTSGLD